MPCEVCKKVDASLQRCAGCSVYYYCSREHQTQDWSTHKSTCKQISAAKKEVDNENVKAQAWLTKNTTPEHNPTANCWSYLELRPWLSARFIYGEFLIRSWRRQGIENALKEYFALLHDNRGDNQGAREMIPTSRHALARIKRHTTLSRRHWNALDSQISQSLPLHNPLAAQVPCLAIPQGSSQVQTKVYKPDGPVPTKEETLTFVEEERGFPGNGFDCQPVVELVTGDDSAIQDKADNLDKQLKALIVTVKAYNPSHL
ncbi:hypothetical protein QBC38DRAFT_529641 [Podospora fimiseda]|uniref:MYND-type domain-containing protein n=1 Tax=Podospora fimiseda TaxID=252190 RepID=A0AAN7BMH0_9PEZI|nr:hypothetical protein QBC38DRAFT_529641 [Podospora fimiseda]